MGKRSREKSESSSCSSDSLFSSSSNDSLSSKSARKQSRVNKKNKVTHINNGNGAVNNSTSTKLESARVAPSWEETLSERRALLESRELELKAYGQQQQSAAELDDVKAIADAQALLAENRVRVDENVAFSDSDSDSGNLFGGTASSTSSSSSSSSGSEDDNETTNAIRERLMAHVQATGAASGASSNPRGTATGRALGTALLRQSEALLRPATSTALAVVSATDESHDVMLELVRAKMPPPPAEESSKLRRLQYVDHRTIAYEAVRKDFYVAPPDTEGLAAEELRALLRELDGAKVRGRCPPRPMRSWNGTGLPDAVLDIMTREGFAQPFAVQSLGAPALMSGRDLLVTAKTGSGKTLAYLLPLVRHCIAQEMCAHGEGPIALVLVPTHELAAQICGVAEKLCAAAKLRLVASYGSTPLAENIKQCRAGCEVMVCTPGRLLDLLTVKGGAVLTMRRVSFVVVDEADRMFDSGFMEHVEAFLKNIRPDRQLALISATMPKDMKKIISSHLNDPIEISVGGKPTPASNVEQRFFFFDEEVYEVEQANRAEDKKFLKLLQILGDEGGQGEHLVIIFTQRREECDELFARLSSCGYQKRIAVLYSGMDPLDREFALEYFMPGNQFILIATGVAERGLDIPYLELVINYTLPDHYEAYVHRIGRTGRAGKKGKAVSFFTRGRDDDIAADLCEGLERAQQAVPEEIYERAAKMRELRKDGSARHNAGFVRGYRRAKRQRFTDRDQKEQFKAAARAAGLEEYLSASSCSDSDADSEVEGAEDAEVEVVPVPDEGQRPGTALALHKGGALSLSRQQEDRIASAIAYARKTTEAVGEDATAAAGVRFEAEYKINDLPELVRVRMQNTGLLRSVAEETGTTIIRKGVYYDPKYKHSHKLKDGVRPLYLLLIGRTAEAVREAVRKLNDAKTEAQSRIQKKASALGAQL